MRLQAVPVLMVTLAFCSAGKRWDTGSTTPDPAGINAAMNLFSQYANNKQGTNPPYRPATTPRFQVTTPGSTPDPTGINAAMNLFSQYKNNTQGTNPPYRPATTPRFQVTTPGSTPDPTGINAAMNLFSQYKNNTQGTNPPYRPATTPRFQVTTPGSTPDPTGINAAMNLFSQYANNKQGTNPPYSPATTPRFQVTTLGSTPAGGTCYAENQAAGKCVKSSMCDMTPNKFDSTLLIGYRSHKKPSTACAFLKVCCPTDKIIPEPVAPASSTAPGCGYSNTAAGMFRERMGTSDSGYADFAEFPWMVALLNNTKLGQTQPNAETNPRYIGGGTLIHPSVVLTVAHKVGSLDPSDLICRAGEWDTENENELYPHQDREVRDIILHNQFDILRSHNNIALVMLVTPFVIQPNINVACLSPTMPAPRTLCYSMGWGMDFTRGKYYASVLKKIPLPLVGSNECERKLRNTRLGRKFHLHRSLTCSGGLPNFDTCIGDGGSPLVCPVENSAFPRYTVVGLVAYGIGCGEAGVPGAYAKVPELYNWISNQMAMENISDRPYVLN